jgi:shikimate kinase
VRRHLILVGLPGSGKSTVGRLLAELLEVRFVDLDEYIVARHGRSIERIFEEQGEPAFRELERREMERVLEAPASVVSPGGGWAAQPGALEAAAGRGFVIYLEADPATAARRAVPPGTRPLLRGADPVARLRALLDARAGFYERADVTLATQSRTPVEIATQAVELARSRAGW